MHNVVKENNTIDLMKALSSMYEKLLANNKAGIEPGLGVKEGRSIKKNFKKMKLQTNIHLINH